MPHTVLDQWHRAVSHGELELLDDLLHDDVVFHSPVVHRPIEGRDTTRLYLTGAFHVLTEGRDFTYVREVVDGNDAVLEFTTDLDGIHVNGVDMLRWDDDGRLVDVTVMLRPRRAMEEVHRRMGALLAEASDAAPAGPA